MTLHIGITIELYSNDESVWMDTIKHNALALAFTLQASTLKHKVTLVNIANLLDEQRHHLKLPFSFIQSNHLNINTIEIQPFNQVKDSLNILICVDGEIEDKPSELLKSKGVKIVGYKCDLSVMVDIDQIIHNIPTKKPYYNRHFDALWFTQGIAELTQSYYQVLHRCNSSYNAPFIWTELPIKLLCKSLRYKGIYIPHKHIAKNIAIFEPNQSSFKQFLHPLMVTELFYRNMPMCINTLQLFNLTVQNQTQHEGLLTLLKVTDLYNHNKITFNNEKNIIKLLPKQVDIIIAHQLISYLDANYFNLAWLGYPLIHNLETCKNLGFYYHKNEVISGADALNKACEMNMIGGAYVLKKKENVHDYRQRQREIIKKYRAEAKVNIRKYDVLIAQLLNH